MPEHRNQVDRLTGFKLGTSKPLPCVFQDPQTPKSEQKFLRSLGHTTVDDPDAFDLIDASSLVVGIGFGVETYLLKKAWPAAILTEDWQSRAPDRRYVLGELNQAGRDQLLQEDLEVEQFEEAYNDLPFMEFKTGPWYSQKGQNPLMFTFQLRKDLDGAADFSFSV